jgi:rod shape-determining protein MreC
MSEFSNEQRGWGILFSRHRSLIFLAGVLLIEMVVFTAQAHRNKDIPLVRQAAMFLVTPFEKAIRMASDGTWGLWRGYLDLRGARRENRQLVQEMNDIKIENQRLQEQAEHGKRLEVLLQFKEKAPSELVAAQVISSGGNENSHLVILDKGQEAGLRPDMPVMVPDGIVGKVLRVFLHSSQVLLLTDENSGVACLLESSRLHGILRGQNKSLGLLTYISNDEKIHIGERVYTSGEDQVFPKGLPVGVVVEARPGASFQEILVQPLAQMNRLEDVLVVTKKVDVDLLASPDPGHTIADVSPAPMQKQIIQEAPAQPGPGMSSTDANPSASLGAKPEGITPAVVPGTAPGAAKAATRTSAPSPSPSPASGVLAPAATLKPGSGVAPGVVRNATPGAVQGAAVHRNAPSDLKVQKRKPESTAAPGPPSAAAPPSSVEPPLSAEPVSHQQ